MRFAIFAACAALCCSAAFSQSKKPSPPVLQKETAPVAAPVWDKEPETIFGLKLGEVLPTDVLPQCPVPNYANKYQQPKEFCIDPRTGPYADQTVMLRMLPLSEITTVAPIYFEDGRFYSLHLRAPHDYYQKLRTLLVERYGPPTYSETTMVKSRAGAEFTSETLTWRGKKNSILLIERQGSIDSSLAAISNNELTELAAKRIQDGLKANASKM
jgi:hypothetical protein